MKKSIFLLISIIFISCASVKKYENIELDLSNQNLVKLPDDILKYKKLEVLNLRNNNFNQFPKQVSSLPNLKRLFLSSNHIDSIPIEILENKELVVLYLDDNNILNFRNLKPMQKLRIISITHNPIRTKENIECLIPKEAQVLYGNEFPTIKGSDCKETK
ncbi:leucine-rich repeat domain-containing protein [Pseudofulvibacter geojedonensis]|uniref:Leucine-rich repeat domain-containing protein n=1 Tax=Pseudofulvibacter geojedonensis TaxID=1123758 RepID=A0ABW3I0M6_9FLAO